MDYDELYQEACCNLAAAINRADHAETKLAALRALVITYHECLGTCSNRDDEILHEMVQLAKGLT